MYIYVYTSINTYYIYVYIYIYIYIHTVNILNFVILNFAEAQFENASLRNFIFATLNLESWVLKNALPAKLIILHVLIWKVKPNLGAQKHVVPARQ